MLLQVSKMFCIKCVNDNIFLKFYQSKSAEISQFSMENIYLYDKQRRNKDKVIFISVGLPDQQRQILSREL